MSEKAIAEKQKKVDELKEKISRSSIMVISDYLGFSVKQITELRKKLHAEDAEYRVVKNTFIERAVASTAMEPLKDHLGGSSALLIGYKDAVAPLKTLVKFIRDNEKGKIRAGVMDENIFGDKELTEISKLPSREVLLSKVVGGLQAPVYGLVNVLQGSIRKLVYALDAVKKQKGGE